MNQTQKMKLFEDVFAPKPDEHVLFLIDLPHDDLPDSTIWRNRRQMAAEWKSMFETMGQKKDFSVFMQSYPATGANNAPLPTTILDLVKQSNLVIAMTEFSATASLAPICQKKGSITRCASMPGVERRMEKTSFQADYSKVKRYSIALKKILDRSIGARISFSTDDSLFIDLRNRTAGADTGECIKTGQTINFPSGEGFKAPYEATDDEIKQFGKSKTEGVLPIYDDQDILKAEVKENQITAVMGVSQKDKDLNQFFLDNPTRRNIAELGIGCNPKAKVIGNILEDEKVPGLHIAYGTSSHIGGNITSDIHQDICFPKHAAVEATSLILITKGEDEIELIVDGQLQFELLS
ncbi:MAG: hypothetical protein R6U21_06450 [Thermoplasmatota archaeon]